MSSIHRFTAILALAAIAGIGQSPAQQTGLIGRWESARATGPGLGQLVEFTEAGQLLHTPGSLVHGRYRLESELLIQTAASPAETVAVQIDVRADTMTQYAANRVDSVRLIRRRAIAGSVGLLGIWTSRGNTGNEAVVEYRPDGTFKLWVPYETDTSAYQLNGDTVTVEGGKLSGRYRWTMLPSQLRLNPIGNGLRAALVFVKRTDG